MIGWFSVPYEDVSQGKLSGRRLEIVNLQSEIEADGGYFAEAEVAGNEAVVRVRAKAKTLTMLGKNFRRLEDPTHAHTPTRRDPYGGREFPTKDLGALAHEVYDDKERSGFKREALRVKKLVEKEGYQRVTDKRLLPFLSSEGLSLDDASTGTFPTTGELDNFTRANAGTLGASWAAGILATYPSFEIISNQASSANDAYASNYWGTSFNADQEAWVQLGADAVFFEELFIRLQAPHTSTFDGYGLAFDTTSAYCRRWTDGGFTQLGGNISVAYDSGEKVGLEGIGSNLGIYEYTGAAWNARTTRTDSTYIATGYIGLWCENHTSARYTSFGGGNVASANVTIGVPVMTMSLAQHFTGADITVFPGVANMSLQVYPPVVTDGSGTFATINVPAMTMAIAGHAPSVSSDGNLHTVTRGSLTLTPIDRT